MNLVLSKLEEHLFKLNLTLKGHQRDIVEKILDNYTSNIHHPIIIDAPTGTGKSYIALALSYCFNELQKNGYIITSDKVLQYQYQSDFSKIDLPWGSVMGIDNYTCTENGNKFSLGDCKIRGIFSKERLEKLHCYSTCGYYSARNYAEASKTSLLNYSYWLIMMNYTKRMSEENGVAPPFENRDFTIFDEAHKIADVVQNHFSPIIDRALLDKFSYFSGLINKQFNWKSTKSIQDIQRIINTLFIENNTVLLLNLLSELRDIVLEHKLIGEVYKKKWQEENKNNKPTKDIFDIFKNVDFFKDVHCKIEDYVELTTSDTLIKSSRDNNQRLIFNNINESGLIKKTLIDQSVYKIFMSATFGDIPNYARRIGLDKFQLIRVPNTWSYERSPIVYLSGNNISAKNKEQSIPKALDDLSLILEKHKDQKGIVHTSSFDNANAIREHFSDDYNIITYDSINRLAIIDYFIYETKPCVLVGPSLTEGLNLYDDLCRFQVIFKLPFPSLADNWQKILFERFPHIYSNSTLTTLLQSLGRGIRHENDWCITYIIDGTFTYFSKNNKEFIPDFILERIQEVQHYKKQSFFNELL